ncbi:unnamed protein product [Rotaria sp. Silwood2]|nr:unnamed protein product [Rotaria sp. Silwood2]
MKSKTNTLTLKSFFRRSQRATSLRIKMKKSFARSSIGSSTYSAIPQVIHHTSDQSLITNERVQNILAYHRKLPSLFPNVSSHIDRHVALSSTSNNIFSSKSSNVLDKNINNAQQHMIPLDSEDLDDNDVDWQSITSEEEQNIDELSENSNEVQSDQNFCSYKKGQSSSPSSSSNSCSTSSEDEEEETSSNHSRTHTTLEIAVLLSLFRHRHQLSKSSITDICRLLRLLGVKNVPADYRSIYRLVNPLGTLKFLPKLAVVCPTCYRLSMDTEKCSVSSCTSHPGYVRAPTVNYMFTLSEQIKSILERMPLVHTGTNDGDMTDVVDGLAHSRIREMEKSPFITLTLNSDGVLVQKISRSLWITTIVINEVPRDIRFQLPNMIIGMISYGSQKPKRAEFQPLLDILVDQLIELEDGIDVCLPSSNDTRSSSSLIVSRVAVYLLGIVSDKPAQSIIQNMIDSGGFYGCGKSVPAGKGHIRCFPLDPINPPDLRSNHTYDAAMKVLEKNKKQRTRRNSLTGANNDEAKGHVGPCALRRLRFFDMGQSFLTDSLHNLYSGTFLKLLKIWLELPSDRKNTTISMSIFNQRKEVEIAFNAILFPTSTYRVPRYLQYYHQYKGNELRLCLLMGYNCFQLALNNNQYKHLQALAFSLHLAEARNIDEEMIKKIDALLKYFNQEFEHLYTKRHIVSVVHSVAHVASSVREYGPIMNYSTFNFESLIGMYVLGYR